MKTSQQIASTIRVAFATIETAFIAIKKAVATIDALADTARVTANSIRDEQMIQSFADRTNLLTEHNLTIDKFTEIQKTYEF